MNKPIKQHLKVHLSKRNHKTNQDGVSATWCYSDSIGFKGSIFGKQVTSDSKDSASFSLMSGGVNICKSQGLGIFLWMNNWDDAYANTIIDTYGDVAYVRVLTEKGQVSGYELLTSDDYEALTDEQKNAEFKLPVQQAEAFAS
jgi:arabinogalactan endo-1,4-beta-galactosidase